MAWPIIELKDIGVPVWPAWSGVQPPDLCAGRDLNCLAENRVKKADCAKSSHFKSKQHFFHCFLIQMAIEMLWSERTLCPCLHSRELIQKPQGRAMRCTRESAPAGGRPSYAVQPGCREPPPTPCLEQACSSELWKEQGRKFCHLCCDIGVSSLSDYTTGCIQGL